uniref:TGF-beta family profile domain-containing protein n=1 Tax=Cyprinus carpio TaxID=7962 RepID=A0A8C1VYH2_CYPCA
MTFGERATKSLKLIIGFFFSSVEHKRFKKNVSVELRGGDGEAKEGSERQLEGAIRLPRSTESPCALHSILLQVRDLGLGYDSDETVLFKYCSGTCPRLASNHDLTLTNLLQSGILQYTGHWHHQPCCRPTHHEDIAFLDNHHRWHKV